MKVHARRNAGGELSQLYDNNSALVDCYSWLGSISATAQVPLIRAAYVIGWTFFQSLEASFTGGGLFRKGLWGGRITRPDDWELIRDDNLCRASVDHSAFVDLNV